MRATQLSSKSIFNFPSAEVLHERESAELRQRLTCPVHRRVALATLLCALSTVALAGTDSQSPEPAKQPAAPSATTSPRKQSSATAGAKAPSRAGGSIVLTVHLIDAKGKPVPGASVGEYAHGDSAHTPKWSFYLPSARSNDAGDAPLRLTARPNAAILLYALDAGRKLAAFQEVADAAFDQPVTIVLVPACHVTGRLVSADFAKLKRPVEWTNVYLFRDKHRSLHFMSQSQELEFFLPPGRYELSAYGTHLESVRRAIEVKPGQTELPVGDLNLPADTLARLFGKPAPEFKAIKGWKNGGPTTLAQLRGKVVVLDFWGYWCGPCVASVHSWMSLHDDYRELGLVVIGIHDDSVVDIADLDRKLKFSRENRWWGRDVPYLVALDGGGQTRIEGTGIDARGATTAAYGITGFPTGVLIDRDGTLVGDFAPNAPEGMNQLRRLLGLQPNPDPLALTHRPSWRKRFDLQNRLAPGQTLRYFPESFLGAREQYVTERLNRYGGDGVFPQRITAFVQDQAPPSEAFAHSGEATLGALLFALAPPGSPPDIYDCPRRLAKLKIPGDWMVRDSSSWADRLKSLEPVLAAHFGKKIRFELGKVDEEVVVVSGRYKFQALPGAVDQGINVTTDDTDLQSSGGGGSGGLSDLLGYLSHLYGWPFLDEVAEKPNGTIHWWQRESTFDVFKKPKKLEATLEILTRQTGLTFHTSRRPVDVWHVRQIE
jgi:thiol-disulfide isomerase/thioredoxin